MLERADEFWAGRVHKTEAIGALPEGMHPQARFEIADWVPLIGAWRCEGFSMASPPSNEYLSIGKATWTFRFGFDGLGTMGNWMPDENPVSSDWPCAATIR